jgi:regulator of protease activity HflC (stomatin/prohibitin superfamily)
VLRYEIKDLTPPQEILRSMQAQITPSARSAR